MKLFFKNTYLPNFQTSIDTPIFYSTYYKKVSPFFLSSKEITVLKQLSSAPLSQTYKTFTNLPQNSSYKLKLIKLELDVLLDNIPTTPFKEINIPFYAPSPLKAKYLYLKSMYNIYKTDLNQASKDLSSALKIYKSHHYYYECGLCYLALAKIYKICAIFDITAAMLIEAEKIFSTHIIIPSLLAEIKAYFGLNELQYENYTNATQYFSEALQICNQHNLNKTLANILNWQSLCYLLQSNPTQTLKTLKKVSALPNLPLPTLLFNHDLYARVYKLTNQYSIALKYTNSALKIAETLNNQTEIMELKFLLAELYYSKHNYLKAKNILTTLIKQKTSSDSLFFKANAYSLLGLISLQENDLKRAKNLFKQSLDLENSKSRTKAIAIDYNNLAEICIKQKNTSTAIHYLTLALENAKLSNDKELTQYLTQKLSDL